MIDKRVKQVMDNRVDREFLREAQDVRIGMLNFLGNK